MQGWQIPIMSIHTVSVNTTKHFNNVRAGYQLQSEYPMIIKYNYHNYLLLLEGLDITWPRIRQQLNTFIDTTEYDKVDIMLKGRVQGLSVNIQLYTPPELIVRMRQLGIEVTFNQSLRSLSIIKSKTVTLIQLCENIRSNVTTNNLNIIVNLAEHRLLIEFFKLTKTPSHHLTFTYEWTGTTNITVAEMLELEDVDSNIIMKWCLRHRSDYIEPLLSTGYIPPIELLIECIHHYSTTLAILQYPQLTDDYKVEFVTRLIERWSDVHYIIIMRMYYRHPILVKYLKMIKAEDIDRLPDTAIEFIINGIVPSILNGTIPAIIDRNYDKNNILHDLRHYDIEMIESRSENIDINTIINGGCEEAALLLIKNLSNDDEDRLYSSLMARGGYYYHVSHRLRGYLSRVPSNNERLLQYMNWIGEELPPPIGIDYSLTRLSYTNNIKLLLDELNSEVISMDDQYKITTLLIQLMNRGVFNPRSYLEHGCKIIDQLVPYRPVVTKNARRVAKQ